MKLFSYDSRFSQLLLKLTFGCWLNLLWIACSLPLVTIGASTTALYSVTLRIAEEREAGLTKPFFEAFKKNFAQATRIWLVMVLVGALIALDAYAVAHLRSSSTGVMAIVWTLNLALLICASIVYVIILMYIFPLLSRFDNTDIAMFKNSFLLGIRYLFCTIMVFFIHVAMFYLIVAAFTPMIVFGIGVTALVSSYFLANVLRTCSYTNPKETA